MILLHFPIAFLVAGFLFVVLGEVTRKPWIQKAGWILLVAASLFGAATYWTGEGAEHVLDAADTGTAEDFDDWIHVHETRAVYSLWTTAAAGFLSLLALWRSSGSCDKQGVCRHAPIVLRMATLVLALAANGSTLLTASAGGEIRHSEIRQNGEESESKPAAPHDDHPQKGGR